MNKILVCLALLMASLTHIFAADATIDIIKTTQKSPLIQVAYKAANEGALAKRIYKILMGDLNVSGHFEVSDGDIAKNEVDYSILRESNIKLFAVIEVIRENGALNTKVTLHDISNGVVQFSKIYPLNEASLFPFIAHKIANDINRQIKAPSIEWMNRYIVFAQYKKSGNADIIISDYTLTYRQTIITGGLNIFPKWADANQQSIYYTKYLKRPTIIKYNIYTGKSEVIVDSDGMAAVSSVSKDGRKVLMTLAPKRQPDIYLYKPESKSVEQLTKYSGIDVSGYFVDSETSMVFISDRGGYANIYSKKLDLDSPAEQVVYHGRNNNSVTSYDNYVAYSSRETDNEFGSNTFNLYLISTKSDYIRRLTAIGNNQMPRFSQDGSSIMFLKHSSGQTALGVIRLDYNKSFLFPLQRAQIQSFDW